jgi:hypothetical protein
MGRDLSHLVRRAVMLALASAPALSCTGINTPIYFNAPAPLELQGTEDPARVTNGLTLRFRAPNQKERMELNAQSDALGFEVPWVARDKVHLEVLFTVQNLDDKAGTFDVLVDGATEFTKYDQNAVAMGLGGDEPQYFPLMNLHPAPLPKVLQPGETYQGVVREDDFAEGAGDLDAMGRWMAPFAAVLINRSEVNPIGMEMVPPNVVTPALMEIDVTFTATSHMTCTWTARVRDDEDRLWHVEGDPRFEPSPALFVPPALEP